MTYLNAILIYRSYFIASFLALLAIVLTPAAMASTTGIDISCTDYSDGSIEIEIPVLDSESSQLENAPGLYAAPESEPTHLVVIGHGAGHTVESWRHHIEMLARDYGYLAVAVNYRGTWNLKDRNSQEIEDKKEDGTYDWEDYYHDSAEEIPKSRGWPVRAGGEDLNEFTRQFRNACTSINTTVLMGVSLGAAMSGWALTHEPKREDGTPLYDYWFAVEGVHNLTETYLEAKATFNDYKDDMEEEAGGEQAPRTYWEAPDEYHQRTNVMLAEEIAQAGLERVIYVHAVYDGLIPYYQSRSMATVLDLYPYEFYTVTARQQGDDGTVIEDHALDNAKEFFDPEAPLAGHAKESNKAHLVMRAAFARLTALALDVTTDCGEYHSYDDLNSGQLVTEPVPNSTYNCNTEPPPPAEPVGGGKIKGSGWLPTGDRKINFSFKANSDEDSDGQGFKGKAKYRDKDSGIKISVDDITAIGGLTGTCGSISPGPNSIEFHGDGTFNDSPAAFRVCAEDNGKGNDAPADRFVLSCVSGCNYHSFSRASDSLGGGNVKLYEPAGQGNPQGQQYTYSEEPEVLTLEPLLEDELPLSSLHQLEVQASDANGNAMATAIIDLRQEFSDGSSQFITVATDENGTASIPVYVTPGTVRYVAIAGELTSNEIKINSVVP